LLREIRIERIAELLRTESISFAAAVRRAGWVDTHHARRLFRERWRQSPAEYRAGANQARRAANNADSLTS
jgi:transcriptional regulator GlxA family with amidase domain